MLTGNILKIILINFHHFSNLYFERDTIGTFVRQREVENAGKALFNELVVTGEEGDNS